MGQIQNNSFTDLLKELAEETASLTGETSFLEQISTLTNERKELLELLNQTRNARIARDKLLEALRLAYNDCKFLEVELLLREGETSFRKEVKVNVTLLKAFKKRARVELLLEQGRSRMPYIRSLNNLKNFQEVKKERAEILSSSEFLRVAHEAIETSLKHQSEAQYLFYNEMSKMHYQITYMSIKGFIKGFKYILKRYALIRFGIKLKSRVIDIFFSLGLFILLIGYIVSNFTIWYLSLIILPTIGWFIVKKYGQPWVDRYLLTHLKRNDLEVLINESYKTSTIARLHLALLKHFLDIYPSSFIPGS